MGKGGGHEGHLFGGREEDAEGGHGAWEEEEEEEEVGNCEENRE